MHRRKLLEALESYGDRYPQESNLVERFNIFIGENTHCFQRDNLIGHVTGSAWLVCSSYNRVLLTHHKKLNRWLQLGGHSDGEADSLKVALREASEESGLHVTVLDSSIFDLDIHEIPARKHEAAHLHFDVRFVLQATDVNFVVSPESHDLRWVNIEDIEKYTKEYSVLRMRDKYSARHG